MKRSHLGAMLLSILISCSFAFGQSATTSLRGVVKDPSGALVPGATVTISDPATGRTASAVTSSAGLYQFPQISPAHYLISVTASGFGNESKTAELLVNQPATIDFSLALQASSITVDVSATAQTLNTTDATIGNSVGNEMIQAMPMDGRNPISLLSLQPGVLFIGTSTDSRNGTVSGGRSDQGNVTLDGIDDNDQVGGNAFTGVLRSTMDSTQEFRVTTANANADAGRSSGAQISLVTKSGTNKLHGGLYEYYRGSFAHANDWFLKQAQLEQGVKNRPAKYVQNVFGGSVGGPILRDKLFYFFNYEGYRNAINTVVSQTVPTTSFMAGQLGYVTTAGSTQYITRSQVATLDAPCTQCTTAGVNDAMLAYYSAVPTANGSSSGDGINSGSYVFSSGSPSTLNTSIVKLDYDLSQKQHLFFRGNLQKDTTASAVQFPGQPSTNTYEDNTKGMAFGHTWTISQNMLNDIRYGYVRQGYSNRGVGQGDYVSIRFLTQPTSQTRTSITSVPLHTITDSLSWTKGNHNVQVGGNWRMITNNTGTDSGSYSSASSNPYWLSGRPPSPTSLGYDGINAGFTNSYGIAYSTLVGNVPSRSLKANYKVDTKTSATLLADGTSIDRHFRTNEFEYYVQDSWRAKPNLTITFGLRHSLLSTPYETKGQQIAPTIDTNAWYKKRGDEATKGNVYEEELTFTPAGKANKAPGYWPRQKLNIAPRFAIVYAPGTKTTIRAGAGMYYDHYGQSIAQRFSQYGSFGLSSTLQNPAATYNYESAPRFTGPHDLPNINVGTPDAKQSYPYQAPDQFAIIWGADNKLKTPYAEAFNLSVQRELPGGFTIEASYVGRIGRKLLQQVDLAEPVNFVDPKGDGDYFSAGAKLSKISDQHGGAYGGFNDGDTYVPPVAVDKIPYFEDVFPQMANLFYEGESATEGMYNAEWAPYRYSYGETTSLSDVDFAGYCFYGGYCETGLSKFWSSQFSSLYAWSSIGTSYYNAGQITLRHPSRNGLSADVSYTLAKSIDMGSDSERSDFYGGSGGGFGPIQNTWNPSLNRGVSDFDTRHLVTADWAYTLPVGRGKKFLGSTGRAMDAVIGGWQWAGLGRWSSGLPFSIYEPGWTTNWELEGWGVNTQKIKTHRHLTPGISPIVQIFDDADAINQGVPTGSPVRLPYPGEAGERNPFRGDGYFNIDSSLSKTWNVADRAKIKLAWEVYNVTNSARFDTYSINSTLTSGTLGAYGGTLTTYRRMQFGLRMDF